MKFQRTNTKISLLEDYYNHFNEDNRLKTRHGNVEFTTNMKYILEYLNNDFNKKIIDIGAGSGAYSCYLSNLGYDVTAVELVKKNLDVLISKQTNVKAIQGNALDLSMFNDKSFDFVILFGPMYHLLKKEEKLKALEESKRILKDDGVMIISYYMNDYAIITYGFIKNKIRESIINNQVDENYHMINIDGDLYSMVRLEDIDSFNKESNLKSIKRFASDGASDYIRTPLNKLSLEDYNEFINYHIKNCERIELMGASSHVVDVVKKI